MTQTRGSKYDLNAKVKKYRIKTRGSWVSLKLEGHNMIQTRRSGIGELRICSQASRVAFEGKRWGELRVCSSDEARVSSKIDEGRV